MSDLATGAELTAETFNDFVQRLGHHVRGEGVSWHHTADALFTVQARKIIFGIDRDYTDKLAVAIGDSMYFSPQEYWGAASEESRQQLDAMADGSHDCPFLEAHADDQWDMLAELDDHTVSGWDDQWEYVNSHFTKEAADAFIARKKHDYRDGMRVYVEAQVYCWEFNAIISGLLDGRITFAAPLPAEQPSNPVPHADTVDAERWRRWMPWMRRLQKLPFNLAKELHEIEQDEARILGQQTKGGSRELG